jgi:hypothetical protein
MSNIDSLTTEIAGLSEADRKALLAKVSAASIHPEMHARIKRALHGLVAPENYDVLIDRLASEGVVRTYMPGEYHASAEDVKKGRLAKLHAAATSSEPAIQSTVAALSGLLRRSGISLTDVVVDDIAGLDRVLASATKPMSVDNRMVCKSLLVRLGIL